MTHTTSKATLRSNGRSPVFAELQIFVQRLYRRFKREKVDPWMLAGTKTRIRVIDSDGRVIELGGRGFDGTLRAVFWGEFVEPFLRDIIIKSVEHAARLADERRVDRAAVFDDARGLLQMVVRGTYHRMDVIEGNQLRRHFQTIRSRKPPPIRRTDSGPMAEEMYRLIEESIGGWPQPSAMPDQPTPNAPAKRKTGMDRASAKLRAAVVGLDESARAALRVLVACAPGIGLQGCQIAGHINLSDSAVRNRIVPMLRPFGVKNIRDKRGYFFPDERKHVALRRVFAALDQPPT